MASKDKFNPKTLEFKFDYDKPKFIKLETDFNSYPIFDEVMDSMFSTLGYIKDGGEVDQEKIVVHYRRRHTKK
jgi:hypothetical protein